MVNRVLNSDGSFSKAPKNVRVDRKAEAHTIVNPVVSESGEPTTKTIVKMDYSIMPYAKLKEEAKERGLEFSGNISGEKLMALLVASDSPKEDTDAL